MTNSLDPQISLVCCRSSFHLRSQGGLCSKTAFHPLPPSQAHENMRFRSVVSHSKNTNLDISTKRALNRAVNGGDERE